MRITKKKLQKITRNLRKSKTFVGCFSIFDNFLIKAKKYSFILACKYHIVCFYVTEKTFEIFDPEGFIKTLRCLKQKTVRKLKSLQHNKKIFCNSLTKKICPILCSKFIKLRDAGNSFISSIKKVL